MQGACAVEGERAVDVASRLKVGRSTIYCWRKSQAQLCSASASAPNKYFAPSSSPRKQYVFFSELEVQLIKWITLMRKTRGLCVTTKCIVLMIGKFDAVFSAARTNVALLSWYTRFLKRNGFSVRRITHKGRKLRDNMINFAVEEDGIFPPSYSEQERYGNLFNMGQTGLGIDNPGRITIDFKGAKTVDVVQGVGENGSRCSVFLCASSTGMKLPAFIVFTGVPEGPVYQEVSSPSWGHPDVIHTTQAKAFCNHATMQKWIDEVCTNLLLFNAFKTKVCLLV
ncbi:hypothetical protein PHMEG_00030172 [Phytophthora megakarya]|uniref:HTH CENPB-type domain-containing protein n=1 Tax=Phytophthora megakarya TaxID=4795 RepID=A0A225V1T7_9STRA|nr:hypothetical protein PHMEG_00030172 [Phytophthora megakarya]